jgi:hypothetical protein
LGITPVFFDPDNPEQNGRHKRMHRDLNKPAAYEVVYQND